MTLEKVSQWGWSLQVGGRLFREAGSRQRQLHVLALYGVKAILRIIIYFYY